MLPGIRRSENRQTESRIALVETGFGTFTGVMLPLGT
jgi:hypothetical protein